MEITDVSFNSNLYFSIPVKESKDKVGMEGKEKEIK